MTRFLIDTNDCVSFIRGQFDMRSKFESADVATLGVSEITLAELMYGVAKSRDAEPNQKKLDIFLTDLTIIRIQNSLPLFAREKARLAIAGTIIADFDLLIGATAIHHGLTLVTNNTKHFQRLNGIKLEDRTK